MTYSRFKKICRVALRTLIEEGPIPFYLKSRFYLQSKLHTWRSQRRTTLVETSLWDPSVPMISVIIPCYNYGAYVNGAIASVLAQTIQDFEIIVIDDGSTEEQTLDILKQIDHHKIRVITQKNVGLAETRNIGMLYARAKYVCFLDADDLLEPTYLEKTVTYLERNVNKGTAYSWLQCFGEDQTLWKTQDLDPVSLWQSNTAPSHSLIRKEAWNKVVQAKGVGFLTKYNGYFEDWVFWIDMISTGYGGFAIKEPLIKYRIHRNSLSAKHKDGFSSKIQELRDDRPEVMGTKSASSKFIKNLHKRDIARQPFQNLNRHEQYLAHEKIIIIFMPWLTCGGLESITLEKISFLKDLGFTVVLMTTEKHHNDWHDKFFSLTPYIYHLPLFIEEEQRLNFIQNFIQTRNVKVLCGIHSQYFYDVISALNTKDRSYSIWDILHNDSKFGYSNTAISLDPHIDRHIVVSDRIKQHFLSQKISNDKVFVLYNGVDSVQRFSREKYNHKTLQSSVPPLKVVFIGRLSNEKRPLDFIKLAQKLQHLDIQWTIIGDGPLYKEIQNKIKSLKLNKVKMLGEVVVDQYIWDSDVLVLTSQIEGFPMVILEAMASGHAIITTDVGDVKHLFSLGEPGFLSKDIGDINFMADKISAYIGDQKLLQRHKENSREIIETHFNLQKMRTVFKDLMGQHRI